MRTFEWLLMIPLPPEASLSPSLFPVSWLMSQGGPWGSYHFFAYCQFTAYEEGTLVGQPAFSPNPSENPNPTIVELTENSPNIQVISYGRPLGF